MAVRKAKWQNNYIAHAYDRINLTVPKGEKDIIKEVANAHGESVNAYIYAAIRQRMEREGMNQVAAGSTEDSTGA